MSSHTHRSVRDLQVKIAVLRRKIQVAQAAKQQIRQHVQAWNTAYAQGLLTYDAFAKKVDTYLQQRSVDAWIAYYDECIRVYQQHIRHYEQQASVARERAQNWKYLSIFLVLALVLGAFLFLPFLHVGEPFLPTGAVTADAMVNQSRYQPEDHIAGNVSIVMYRDNAGLDLVPDTTWVNVSIVDAQGGIFNTSSLNISTFIANAMNSTVRDCFNVTTGKFNDVNGTWPSEGQIGTGYGYNQSLACMDFRDGADTNINTYTVNFTAFFRPFLRGPSAGNGYNITINMTNGTNVERITFAYAAFNTSRPPSITSVTINPSNPQPTDNLTAAVAGIADPDFDSVNITYNWYVNNKPITVLNMPMTNAFYSYGRNITFDFSGLDNHGRIGNDSGTTFNPTWANNGLLGGAYQFDGSNDMIGIPFSQAFNFTLTRNFTLEAWIVTTGVPAATSSPDWILGLGGTNTFGWRIGPVSLNNQGSSFNYGFQVGDTNCLARGGTGVFDTWKHIVGVFNDTTVRLFIDGSLAVSTTCTGALTSPIQTITVGSRTSSPAGLIDQVRIYNRSLTEEEIGAIYNAGIRGTPYHNITVTQEIRLGEVWNVSATPVDSEGLNGTTIYSNSVTIADADSISPVVRLLSPTNATNTTALAINFSFSTSDDGFIAYANLSGTWTNDIFTFNNSNQSIIQNGFTFENFINISHMPEGNWTWNIQVCDVTGNCGWNTTNFTITIDRTAPFPNITQPLNNSINTTSTFIDFYYNVTDITSTITNCSIIINNTQTITATNIERNIRQNISVQLVDGGLYNATLSCFDQTGNNGNSTYTNFSIGIPLTPTLACTMSDALFNITFGDNVQQGNTYNATKNYYPEVDNLTMYNITTTGSNIPINISIKGDHFYLNDFTRMLGAGNVSWNSTVNRSLANFSMFYPGKANLTTYYQNSSATIATKLFPGGTAWLRYWLTIPQNTYAGKYTANFTILCEDAREQ